MSNKVCGSAGITTKHRFGEDVHKFMKEYYDKI